MLTENVLDQALGLWNESRCKELSSGLIRNCVEDEQSQRLVCGEIKRLLSSSVTRINGVELLNSCIDKFSSEVLSEFGPNCVKICLSHHEEDKHREVYLKTITNVVRYSRDNHEFHKKFVADFLASTIELCLKSSGNSNIQEVSIECLISCLESYSTSCNTFKKKIEEFITKLFSTSTESVVIKSGILYFWYQKVGNAGNEGINHTTNISVAIQRLTLTCHQIYDEIFKNETEFERNFINNRANVEPLEIKRVPLHFNDNMKLEYYTQIFKNSISWLIILLCKGSNKIVHPKELLGIVQRGVSLHSCMDENITMKSSHFALNLIEIQTVSLKLLTILIKNFKMNLAPFYYTISKIIFDMIARCSSCKCYKEHTIKEYIYKTSTVWFEYFQSGIHESHVEKLIIFLMNDAFPVVNLNVTLINIDANLIGKSAKSKQKYIRNKITKSTTSTTNTTSSYSRDFQLNICLNSLKFLESILKSTHISLSEKVVNKLNYNLIKSITSIQNGNMNYPLSDSKCRKHLYTILTSIFEQDSIQILPSLNVSLKLLSNGTKDENIEIFEICTRGLNILEKICQPSCRSLNFNDKIKHTEEVLEDFNHQTESEGENEAEIIDNRNNENIENGGIKVICNEIIKASRVEENSEETNSEFNLTQTSSNFEEPVVKKKKLDVDLDLLDSFVDAVHEDFD